MSVPRTVEQSIGYPAGSALDKAAQHHVVSVRLRGRIQINFTTPASSLLLPRRDHMAGLPTSRVRTFSIGFAPTGIVD